MLHSKQSQGNALTKGRENDKENEKRTTNQRERETQRHCRASLLEIEIEHSVEVLVRSSVNLRIVLHKTERFERELLIDITDVCDRTIRKNRKEEHAFREARVRASALSNFWKKRPVPAPASNPTAKKNTARWRDTHGNS